MASPCRPFGRPAKDQIELAMALWDSLTDAEREAEFVLTAEQEAELDRPLEEHLASPGGTVPWEEVRLKLANGGRRRGLLRLRR